MARKSSRRDQRHFGLCYGTTGMPPSQVLQDVPLNFAATGRKAAVTARVRSPLTSHTCWIARVRLALCSYSPCSVLNTCLALCFSFPCSWYDMFIPCDSGCQSKALSMIPPFPTSPAWSPLPGSAKLVARSLYAEDSSRRAGLHALCSVAVGSSGGAWWWLMHWAKF